MLKRLLISKWVIAVVLTVPVLMLIPTTTFKKYKIEKLSSINKYFESSYFNYFTDLNGDNVNERIQAIEYNSHLAFVYFDHNNSMYDQCNFPGTFDPKLNTLFFFDTDKNGFTEVYGFTRNSDSLFINWYEPFPNHTGKKESCFISIVHSYGNNQFDVQIPDLNFVDFDGDGDYELLFVLHNGFSKSPRKIIVFHPQTKQIQYTQNQGATFGDVEIVDLNQDMKSDIVCETRATNNFSSDDTMHVNDNCTWLIAYNNDLKYLFKPVKIQKGIGSRLTPYIFNGSDSKKEIIALAQSVAPQNKYCTVFKFNRFGQTLDSLEIITKERRYVTFSVKENEQSILVQLVKDKMHRISSDLKRVEEIPLIEGKDLICFQSCDINFDGKPEYLFHESGLDKLYIFSDNFRHFNKLELDEPMMNTENFVYSKDIFIVETKSNSLFYSYKRNIFYELKYFVWLLVYFLITGIVFLIQKLQENRIKERYELQNQVRELQFKTFRNQLDPHFIFNTFNSVASVIKQGRTEEAYTLFMGFSKMLRASLSNTENILISLQDELTVVKNYLEIQKFRFVNQFKYTIQVDPGVDMNLQLPKMLMQIHIENAVNHGLRPKKEGGILLLKIFIVKQLIHIHIEDNGIGRAESQQQKTHGTGLGLKTLEHFIQYVNREKKGSIKQNIVDLQNESGVGCGTRVEITLSNI